MCAYMCVCVCVCECVCVCVRARLRALACYLEGLSTYKLCWASAPRVASARTSAPLRWPSSVSCRNCYTCKSSAAPEPASACGGSSANARSAEVRKRSAPYLPLRSMHDLDLEEAWLCARSQSLASADAALPSRQPSVKGWGGQCWEGSYLRAEWQRIITSTSTHHVICQLGPKHSLP